MRSAEPVARGRLRSLRERIETRLSGGTPSQRLGFNNLYIVPNAFGGLWLAGTVVLYLVGINTSSNGPLLLAFLCTGLFLLTLFLTQANLQGLELAIATPAPGFAGELVPYGIQLRSARQRYLLRLRFRGQPLSLQALVSPGTSLVQLQWQPSQRGLQCPGRLQVYAKAPLGLFTCWCYWQPPQPQLIYPSRVPGPVLETLRPLPMGSISTATISTGGSDDLHDLAPHRPEDGLQRVAWKQLARGRGWQTKRFERQVEQERLLAMHPNTDPERALQHLCARVLELSHQGQAFALQLPGFQLSQGSGSRHRDAALQALAQVRL